MKRQERMRLMVQRMQHYWNAYSDQHKYEDYSDETFLLDALYGIGLAINRDAYEYAGGFEDFQKLLTEFLADQRKAGLREVKA